MFNPYVIGACFVVACAIYWKGYSNGSNAQRKKHVAATKQLNKRLHQAEVNADQVELKRLEETIKLDEFVEQLEVDAHEDPSANHPAVNADGVQRLNRIR